MTRVCHEILCCSVSYPFYPLIKTIFNWFYSILFFFFLLLVFVLTICLSTFLLLPFVFPILFHQIAFGNFRCALKWKIGRNENQIQKHKRKRERESEIEWIECRIAWVNSEYCIKHTYRCKGGKFFCFFFTIAENGKIKPKTTVKKHFHFNDFNSF